MVKWAPVPVFVGDPDRLTLPVLANCPYQEGVLLQRRLHFSGLVQVIRLGYGDGPGGELDIAGEAHLGVSTLAGGDVLVVVGVALDGLEMDVEVASADVFYLHEVVLAICAAGGGEQK